MTVAATGDPLILGEEPAPKGVLDAEICAHTYLSLSSHSHFAFVHFYDS